MALERPTKRVKLLNNDSSEESASETSFNHREVAENQHGFKINKDYARRFEHNKQREDKQRRKYLFPLLWRRMLKFCIVEEKFGNELSDSDDSSSEDDDDGDLHDP